MPPVSVHVTAFTCAHLLLLIGLACPAPGGSCRARGALWAGASTFGTNLSPGGLAAADAQSCLALCCADPLCAGFTFTRHQRTATVACPHGGACCWLKGT